MGACEGVGFYPSPHDVKPRGFDVPWGPGWHSYCAYIISLLDPLNLRVMDAAGGDFLPDKI